MIIINIYIYIHRQGILYNGRHGGTGEPIEAGSIAKCTSIIIRIIIIIMIILTIILLIIT